MEQVLIAPADPGPRQVAALFEVFDDLSGSAFTDSDPSRGLAYRCVGRTRDRGKYMHVVGEKQPAPAVGPIRFDVPNSCSLLHGFWCSTVVWPDHKRVRPGMQGHLSFP